jgi:hypothetical protein
LRIVELSTSQHTHRPNLLRDRDTAHRDHSKKASEKKHANESHLRKKIS